MIYLGIAIGVGLTHVFYALVWVVFYYKLTKSADMSFRDAIKQDFQATRETIRRARRN